MLRDAIAVTRTDVRAAAPVHDPFRPGDIAHIAGRHREMPGRALGYEPFIVSLKACPLVVDWYLKVEGAGNTKGRLHSRPHRALPADETVTA
jgi:hypothetical protein